jgi:hypothetical protein
LGLKIFNGVPLLELFVEVANLEVYFLPVYLENLESLPLFFRVEFNKSLDPEGYVESFLPRVFLVFLGLELIFSL